MKYCVKDRDCIKKIIKIGADFKSRRMRFLEREFETSSEFRVLSQKEQILYKKLKMALPEECLLLLADYSDILTETEALRQYFFYRGGFDDAVFIYNFLNHRYIRY